MHNYNVSHASIGVLFKINKLIIRKLRIHTNMFECVCMNMYRYTYMYIQTYICTQLRMYKSVIYA